MYYFTADEHHYHANIIRFCNRPFKDAEEMSAEIIRRHNEAVGVESTATMNATKSSQAIKEEDIFVSGAKIA